MLEGIPNVSEAEGIEIRKTIKYKFEKLFYSQKSIKAALLLTGITWIISISFAIIALIFFLLPIQEIAKHLMNIIMIVLVFGGGVIFTSLLGLYVVISHKRAEEKTQLKCLECNHMNKYKIRICENCNNRIEENFVIFFKM